MLVIKIAQGVVRFIYLFHDIAGFGNSLKCILGFESVVDKIPQAADRVCLHSLVFPSLHLGSFC